MKTDPIEVDERAVLVNRSAGYQAYRVMSWLLVFDLGLHGYRPEWTTLNGFPLDILIILEAGGLTCLWFNWHGDIVSGGTVKRIAMAFLAALLVASVLALIVRA